jgi:uncharacterized membrane protein (DUF373 family)
MKINGQFFDIFLRLLKLFNYQFLLEKNENNGLIRTICFIFIFLQIFVLSLSYLRTQSYESFSKVELHKNVG